MPKRLILLAGLTLSAVLIFGLRATHHPAAAEGLVRQPAVAGTFYPADDAQLRAQVDQLIKATDVAASEGEIIGLFVPHAGYVYSASTAAAAYSRVMGKDVDIVVVLAPSHRDAFAGVTVYPGRAYRTPLGEIAIDQKTAKAFVETCAAAQFSHLGHGSAEHSLEVQLPFVQHLFPDAALLPIMVGQVDWITSRQTADALGRVLADKRSLLIASTDLYHGHSYEQCKKSDEYTLAALERFAPEAFWREWAEERCQACGGAAAVIMQMACRELGADNARVVARTNSNDATGTRGGYVVGYGSGVVYRSGSPVITYPELNLDEQRELLRYSRQAIATYLQTGKTSVFTSEKAALQQKRGCFVTLTRNGQLRGCIGVHESDRPLIEMVPDRAVAAAFFDPRFQPLQADELDKIKIKISVYLTNVYRISSIEEFQMGVHGIILLKNGKGATFLPEVPIEAGWRTKEEEMQQLCHKAGLPPDAWKKDAEFWVYKTQIFDESVLEPKR